jgi:putative flippase GtrA
MLDRFARFSTAGAVGTALHYSILLVLVETVRVSPVVATGCGAVVGASVNYALNYRLTFQSTVKHSSALPRFALIAIAGTALNTAVVYVLVLYGIHYLLSQAAATMLVLVLGFFANQFWTFAETRNDDSTRA